MNWTEHQLMRRYLELLNLQLPESQLLTKKLHKKLLLQKLEKVY